MVRIQFIILVLVLLFIFFTERTSRFSEPKLKVLISTCKNYREKSIQPLLDNLKNIDVIVVSGGEESDDISDPVLKKTKYQFWEYTGLIYLAENPEPDESVYFMIHDTVKIGPKFVTELQKKYKEFLETRQEGQRLMMNNSGSSMSMGFYTQKLIDDNKNFLINLKEYVTDEESLHNSKYKGFGLEDHLIREFNVMWGSDDVDIKYEGHKCLNHIPKMDFTKVQTNCQGKPLVFTYDL